MQRFVIQFRDALRDALEPYFEDGVYIDEERLRPGYEFNHALAQALCHSLCMIVIYVPRYDQQEYCVREFRAMELLERRRRELAGGKLPIEKGMIIPIVFRPGAGGIPARIKGRVHYADFSKFTTASPDIRSNPEYVNKIEEIAAYIDDLSHCLSGVDTCHDCPNFVIPPIDSDELSKPQPQSFPGR